MDQNPIIKKHYGIPQRGRKHQCLKLQRKQQETCYRQNCLRVGYKQINTLFQLNVCKFRSKSK